MEEKNTLVIPSESIMPGLKEQLHSIETRLAGLNSEVDDQNLENRVAALETRVTSLESRLANDYASIRIAAIEARLEAHNRQVKQYGRPLGEI